MKKILILLFSLAVLFGCSRKELPLIDPASNIVGLATGLKLPYGPGKIVLADFFPKPEGIDRLRIPAFPDSLYRFDGQYVHIQPVPEMDPVMAMEVTVGGVTEYIPLFRSDKQLITFQFDPGNEEYNAVSARGEFNGWTAGRPVFTLSDGAWKGEMLLSPGSYQYLITADGKDMVDPANPDSVDNNMGGFNSVLTIGEGVDKLVPHAYTVKSGNSNITIAIEGDAEEVFVLWQNKQLKEGYIKRKGNGEYQIIIPAVAKDIKRSFLRVWAWNEHGLSNDLLIPLENGNVLRDASQLNRNDMHSMVIYNAFVDRFNDADPANNRPLNIPEVLPPADYHGGDIKGVTAKIKDGYFKDLGVNAIWISPIVKNPEEPYGFWPEPASKFSGYHGYWPVSFTLIDDRYGNEDDLRELVSVAHDNEMSVLLDFVANHVHEDHPVYRANPEWATELYLPDGSLNTERWDEYRLTTWFDVFLPTLDLEKPEVYNMLVDSALYWIKKYELDGFRHDATKHIPEVFWRELTRKLKTEVMIGQERSIYQIGETYGGPELISSYVGSGMLDAQFDFNVYDDALAVINKDNQPFSRLEQSLRESLKVYGAHNLMGYITGNQDRGRFTSYAGGGLRFDEDAKLAGWTRDVVVGKKEGYDRTKMLFAFNMTIPGLPVIYYGDEIGMPGGNDPDSRRMMRFSNLIEEEKAVLETVQMLANTRLEQLPLVYGDFKTLLLTDDTWAYSRTYFDEIIIVVMNKSDQTKNLTFDLPGRFADIKPASLFGAMPGLRKGKMSVTIGARDFDIILAK